MNEVDVHDHHVEATDNSDHRLRSDEEREPFVQGPGQPRGTHRGILQAGSDATSVLGQHRFHLRDLRDLAVHDLPAQGEDRGVREFGFPAHQDRPGMVRDHGPKELPLADHRLLTDREPECESPDNARS